MSTKELSPLEQILVDTIQKSSAVTGEIYDAAKGVSIKAIDFAEKQIPDIIHQLLMWKLAEAIVYMILAIITMILFIKFWFNVRDYSRKSHDIGAIVMYSIFGGLFTAIFGVLLFVTNILDVVQITIAPKIYLIEYAADIVKSVKK